MGPAATTGTGRTQSSIWSYVRRTAGRGIVLIIWKLELMFPCNRPRMRTLHSNRISPLHHHQSHTVSLEMFSNNKSRPGLSRTPHIPRNSRAAIQCSRLVLRHRSNSYIIMPLHRRLRQLQADRTSRLRKVPGLVLYMVQTRWVRLAILRNSCHHSRLPS